ncbi:MAG: CheR family methyltransferase [Candidatus Anammoxibacter sp.]
MVPTLNQKEFELFQKLIYTESGIKLNSSKKNLVQARFQKRLRINNISSFTDYYNFVTSDPSREELVHMIDCISTNKTHFFREVKHFDIFNDRILPGLINERKGKGGTIRIWCAASSTGEEPYTIAMLLCKQLETAGNLDVKILATDISTRVLHKAIKGVYSKEQVKDVPPDLLNKFFAVLKDGRERLYEVNDCVKNLVTYRKFNLLDLSTLSHGKFDIIFCRNVMIYFDYETRHEMLKHFYNILSPNGFFFLSHSETLAGRDHDFKFVQPAVYQK